jgi:PAS domain S-box-containing protein
LVLGVSLVLTALGWAVSERYVQQRAAEQFAFQIEEARIAIGKRMAEYEQVLRGGVGLFLASTVVTREEWAVYVRSLQIDRYFPGIQGIGFARWLDNDARQTHVAMLRQQGFPAFDIYPEGARESYGIVDYLEPFSGRNLRAFGYDMYSEPVRRDAMDRARDSGLTAVSGRVTLVQETSDDVQAGFLMYLPVYRAGASVDDIAQRRSALLGFVYSPFRCNDLLAGILGRGPYALDFRIYDGNDASADKLLYDSKTAHRVLDRHAALPAFAATLSLQLPERMWSIHFTSRPAFERSMASSQPLIIASGGITVDLLLFSIIWSLSNRHKQVEKRAETMTTELAQERGFLRALIENLAEGVIACDRHGTITLDNRASRELFGFLQPDDAVAVAPGTHTLLNADGGGPLPPEQAPLLRALRGEHLRDFEALVATADGSRRHIVVSSQPIHTVAGELAGAVAVLRDVTEDKHAQRLRESESRFRMVVEAAPNAMLVLNERGQIQLINGQAERLFGYQRQELYGRSVETLVPPRFRAAHRQYRTELAYTSGVRPMGLGRELSALRKDGSEVPIEVGLSTADTPSGKLVLAAVVDNTARRAAESALRNSLAEKETLLNEIHHRVKNNLQVITSLLNLQASHTRDPQIKQVLADSQARVKAMALIHQLLYEHEDFSQIQLGEYIERLTKLIMAGYALQSNRIRLEFIAEGAPVYLDLNRAIACGLVVTELVTNAIKHAYPDSGSGVVRLTLGRDGRGEAVLTVSDEGVGLPADFELGGSRSLGLQLVPLLVDQLGGRLSIGRGPGARFELRFQPLDLHEAAA